MENILKANSYKNIKSKYILQRIFANLTENKLLQIVKYNKDIQKELEKDINDYIKYFKKVIIKIIPINKKDKNSRNEKEDDNSNKIEDKNFSYIEEKLNKNYFIKYKEEEKQYYHIYFNDDKEEKHRNYFTEGENVTKIIIIIDEQIKSFEKLFYNCECIEKINFIKFKRKDINNMSWMFYGCSSLKEINIKNWNTKYEWFVL